MEERSSARPTAPATASVWTGCAVNRRAARRDTWERGWWRISR